jgi:microcystin-dependent protein
MITFSFFKAALYGAGLLLASMVACAAEVPKLINYQGKLTNATGEALPDGEYSVKFELYDAAADGNLVWGESRTVTLIKGVFNVALGGAGSQPVAGAAVNDIGFAFGGSNRFLQTTIISGPNVQEGTALLPRQQMTSVPYAVTALHGVPAGTVVPFAGTVVPEGWVQCEGQLLNGADPQYARLRAAISTTYGSGADNEFRVPDLRGRTPIGSGQGDTWFPGGVNQSTDWALGQKFGAEKHQLSLPEIPRHDHDFHDPGHRHKWGEASKAPTELDRGGDRSYWAWFGAPLRDTTLSKTNITINPNGEDQPHNNMQPSLVLNYIIKL